MTESVYPVNKQAIQDAVELLMAEAHGIAKARGWWNGKDGKPKDRNDGELFTLMHSELSEAFEAFRTDAKDQHLPQHEGRTVELGDLLYRVFDYAAARKLMLGEAMADKGEYNTVREDHSPAARAKPGGKKV